jgi:predicted RecB family nuclease
VYVDDDLLVLSPTDLTKHLACRHLTNLDLQAARGEIARPAQTDETLELIFRLGLEHEASYLQSLRDRGLDVVVIPEKGTPLAERVALTEQALRDGAEVIYQATFLHEGHRGHADFLLRTERPSDLGAFSYDVADTKLARKMKVAALLQMADYGRHLERLQGHPPEWLTVVTGDGAARQFRYADAAAYARRATEALRDAVDHSTATRPEPNPHCAQCIWAPKCQREWRAADHLSLVAFMRTDHRELLEQAGITTLAGLAGSNPDELPISIGEPSRLRLRAQAVLQLKERMTGRPHYELFPPVLDIDPLKPPKPLGLLRLPPPSPNDVYLDFEGDPYAEGGEGREYLAGLWDRSGTFTTLWAHSNEEERTLTHDLLRDLVHRLDQDPTMHIYHYAPYERTALARLTQRHGVGESDFDRLLRGETLVDLYAVVRQGLRISKGSYSIKKLEAFYWGGVRGSGEQPDDVADALASVVAYEKWLAEPDQSILDGIAAYNRDDVRSTHDLHAWLEERRTELEQQHGEQPRPLTPDSRPPERVSDAEAAENAIVDELRDAGQLLMAGLVGWHRREGRPQWWDFYRCSDLTDDALVRDSAALGELGAPELIRVLPKPARSTIYRYPFPPQDTKVREQAYDVDTHDLAGTVTEIDGAEGWVDLKVGNGKRPPYPRGLSGSMPIDVGVTQKSLQRTASDVLAGRQSLGRRLLDRITPPDSQPRTGETAEDVVVRLGRALRDTVLAVQGPPGSGKTTVGASMIRAMLDDGLRVGVTAQSHAVIGHLLTTIGRPALQKCDEDDHCAAPGVEQTNDNKVVVSALASRRHQLVGGTAWLWSREELTEAIDVLVIDEAGQFSLANAVAVARSAKGLVLLGDPQQLAQPSQAHHPDGAGVSALEHLLDGHATVPPDRGVFLDQTWRMHPRLADVVSGLMYDGRLMAGAGRQRQELRAPEPWAGAGVRWLPVEHVGNEAASTQEADEVRRVVDQLVGSAWVDWAGEPHEMRLADVLVVAPYNAHVARLKALLPKGSRVGTVDKFQGQEAPVVIYSMASSSAQDAPRGVTFLYDLHRLNVAISRARCVAVVVGSPALLDASVNSPEQLRAVNGLITVVEAGLREVGELR